MQARFSHLSFRLVAAAALALAATMAVGAASPDSPTTRPRVVPAHLAPPAPLCPAPAGTTLTAQRGCAPRSMAAGLQAPAPAAAGAPAEIPEAPTEVYISSCPEGRVYLGCCFTGFTAKSKWKCVNNHCCWFQGGQEWCGQCDDDDYLCEFPCIY